MKLLPAILLGCLLQAGPAHASADFTAGSLYRTAGVPAWNAAEGSFTIMLWIYAPSIVGTNDFFTADDGGTFGVYVNLGTAADSPTEPYFITRNGEWHFNKDGTYVANPAQSFDVSLGWTFLAVSFTQGGATDLYAWQAGVNHDAMVHVPVQSSASSIAGSGFINTFTLGDESRFNEGCRCLMGPVYVYNGLALTQAQIDAQRLQASPIVGTHLIVHSSFVDGNALTLDESGTANWSAHNTVRLNNANPPVTSSSGGGSGGGGSGAGGGAGGGGTMGLISLLSFLGAAALRLRRRAQAG